MNPGEVQIRLRSSSSTTGAKESTVSSIGPSNMPARGLEDQGDGRIDKKMKSVSVRSKRFHVLQNHEGMVRMIKIGEEEYYTIDEDDVIPEQWWSEDTVKMRP